MGTSDLEYRASLASAGEQLRSSGALGRSDLLIRLFDFLLESSLAGHAPKEIEIARQVFNRTEEIDLHDSPVRIYAHRLRKKLEQAYVTTPEGTKRLTLPRGEYRLVFASETGDPEGGETVAGRGLARYPNRLLIGGLLALLSLAGLVWLASSALTRTPRAEGVALTAFWQPLTQLQRPAIIVEGDYYVFGEIDEHADVRRFIHQRGINSASDLQAYRATHPQTAGRYVDIGRHFVPSSVAASLGALLPMISKSAPAKMFNPSITASQLSPEQIENSDIVYVGLLSSLGLLREPLFATSGLAFGDNADQLTDKASGRRFVSDSEVLNENAPHREYAYIASLPGPKGNRMLIISGARDASVMRAAQIVIDPEQLRLIAEKAGTGSFEALYEVSTLKNVNIGSQLVLARPLSNPPLFRNGAEAAPLTRR